MKNTARYITWLLLAVFGLIITPKELVHECYGHEDTRCNPGDRPALESVHHHCEILQLACPLYTTPGETVLNAIISFQAVFADASINNPSLSAPVYFNLRAPPLS